MATTFARCSWVSWNQARRALTRWPFSFHAGAGGALTSSSRIAINFFTAFFRLAQARRFAACPGEYDQRRLRVQWFSGRQPRAGWAADTWVGFAEAAPVHANERRGSPPP